MVSRRSFVAGALSTSVLAPSGLAMTATAQSGDPVPLNGAGIDYNYTPAVVEAFQEAHPEIEFEFAAGILSFEGGQIQTVLQSGEGPDVINVNSGPGRVGLLASSGLIVPLDDFYERSGAVAIYQPNVIEQIRNQNADQKIYEVVEGLDVFQVYYNTDLFADNAIEIPQTWEEFLTACQTLKDAGIQPFVLGARDNFAGGWLLGGLVQSSAGRDVMTELLYGEGDFTHPDILRGLEMLQQLVEEEYINGLEAAALTNEQARAAFPEGDAAMVIQGQGYPITLESDGVDTSNMAAFLLPSRNEGQDPAPTAGLAHSWVINADSENQEAAETWLEWVVSDEYLQLAMANGGALVPARIVPGEITLPAWILDASSKLAAGAGYNPSVYLPAGVVDAWYQALQNILTAQATPQQAIDQLQEALVASRAGS